MVCKERKKKKGGKGGEEKGGMGCLRRTGMLLEGWTVSPYGCGGSIHRITCTVLLQGRSVLIAICIEEMRRDIDETIVEGVKDSAAAGKRLRWDSLRSSTAVGSNPWER
jgi:hypothetical protein